MAYCPKCGTEFKPDLAFCTNCGAAAGQTPAVTPAPVPPPASAKPSPAKMIGRIASIAALVGFLLPWISCQGFQKESLTGIGLASHGDLPLLWLIPLAMLLALAITFNIIASLRQRAKAAKILIGCGAVSTVVMLYYYARLQGVGESDPMGLNGAMRQAFTIEYGAFISLLGSIGVAVAGFLDLKSPPGN